MSRICIGDHRITIKEHGMLIQDVEAYVGNDSRIIEDSNFMELITDYL